LGGVNPQKTSNQHPPIPHQCKKAVASCASGQQKISHQRLNKAGKIKRYNHKNWFFVVVSGFIPHFVTFLRVLPVGDSRGYD
jgi:hypothetical protein